MSRQASELAKNSTFVRAGAGAGKTTKLISTFYDFSTSFKKEHQRWPRVILSTFTRKATQEIRERLIATALKKEDPEFLAYLNRRNLVQISTIHGLLQNILNRNHDQVGFQSQFTIIDDAEERKRLFRYVKSRLKSEDFYLDLLEHFKISEIVDLTQRLIRLHRQFPDFSFVTADELKAVTNAKAAASARNLKVIVQEFERLDPKILSKWTAYLDVVKSYTQLLAQGDIEKAISYLDDELPKKPSFSKEKPPFSAALHDQLVSFWKASENKFSFSDTQEFFEDYALCIPALSQLTKSILEEWTLSQQKNGCITMSDMELLSLKIATQSSEAMADYASEIDFIMLDEFQDTSPLQLDILQPLLKSIPTFIVGDPQQSIYLFRGARAQVFSEMNQKALLEGRKIELLKTNYRSAPDLLEFLNSFFTNVSPDFSPMNSGRVASDFQPSVFGESRVLFIESSKEYLSCEHVIQRLLSKGVRASDICILSPRQKLLIECVTHLRDQGFPAELQLAGGLSQKREVIDFVSFLKFLVVPYDNENLLKLVRSPWFFVSDQSLYNVTTQHSSKSLWSGLLLHEPDIAARLELYRKFYQSEGFISAIFHFLRNEKVMEWSLALDSTGRFESNLFKMIHSLISESQRPGFTLNEYLERNAQVSVELESDQSESPPADHQDSIHCMTVHGSKGLQFKHVILIGFNHEPSQRNHDKIVFDEEERKVTVRMMDFETSKPCLHAWGDAVLKRKSLQEDQEYLRLLYVAATRAEESLCIISESDEKVKSRSWRGRAPWPDSLSGTESNSDAHLQLNLENFLGHHILKAKHSKDYFENFKKEETVQETKQILSSLDLTFLHPRSENTETSGPIPVQTKRVKTVSVTSLVEKNSDFGASKSKSMSQASVARPALNETSVAAQLKALSGTRAHAIFESLKYLPTGEKTIPDYFVKQFTPTEIKAAQYLIGLRDVPLLEILKHGFVEFGFKLKTKEANPKLESIDQDLIVQGQIDAWGRLEGSQGATVYVIDYKTGDQKYKSKAFEQLAAYARCLKEMNFIQKTDKVQLVTIFPIDEVHFSEALS